MYPYKLYKTQPYFEDKIFEKKNLVIFNEFLNSIYCSKHKRD